MALPAHADPARHDFARRLFPAEMIRPQIEQEVGVQDRRTGQLHLEQAVFHHDQVVQFVGADPEFVLGLFGMLLDRLEVDGGRPDVADPIDQLGKLPEVELVNHRLDDDRKIQAVLAPGAGDVADSSDDGLKGTVDAARIVVDFGVVGIDRDIDVEWLGRDRPIDHLLIAERGAVGSHAPFEILFAAEGEQLDEALLDVRLAAGKFDVVMTDEIFQIKQRLFPVIDRHVVAIVRAAPIFAIAAFVVTSFDHFAVDRHRHRHVAAGAQIDFFRDGVADVIGAETCQFQDVHELPRKGSTKYGPPASMVPQHMIITKQLPA